MSDKYREVVNESKIVFKRQFGGERVDFESDVFSAGPNDWILKVKPYNNEDFIYSLKLVKSQQLVVKTKISTILVDMSSEPNDELIIECPTHDFKHRAEKDFRAKIGKDLEQLLANNAFRIELIIKEITQLSEHFTGIDFKNTFNVKELNDLEIIVGKKQLFASKQVLSSRSDVFRAMFENDMSEQNTNRLEIKDIESQVFEEFLKFLYFGNSDKLEEMRERLLEVADKYQVMDLKNICENMIFIDINAKNAIKILKTFNENNSNEMKTKSIEFIVENMSEIIGKSSVEWLELLKSDDQLAKQIFEVIAKHLISSSTTDSIKVFTYSYLI